LISTIDSICSYKAINQLKYFSFLKFSQKVLVEEKFEYRVANQDDFKKVAILLSNEMYGTAPIPKAQKLELIRLEEQDLRSRYGNKKYTSKLIVAEDVASRSIIACVGLDSQEINVEKKKLKSCDSWTEAKDMVAVLANLAVDSSFRGKGIAKQLVQMSESEVKKFDYDNIFFTNENSIILIFYF
jgi:predicted N-acetyltransferase YhbS